MAKKKIVGSQTKRLSVIIPLYNEEITVNKLLDKVFEACLPEGWEREVVIVDDCSTDGSLAVVNSWQPKIKVIRHKENMGKGASVRDGFFVATGDVVLIQDADLEYDPNDWMVMLEPFIQEKADVVFGSRLITDRPHRVLYFWHYLGNKVLTAFSNMMTNLNLSDMETCYKMFSRKVIDDIKAELVSPRFGIEPELTARVKKYRVYEVGISYAGRTYGEGKKIGWRDGIAAFWHIIRFNLFP